MLLHNITFHCSKRVVSAPWFQNSSWSGRKRVELSESGKTEFWCTKKSWKEAEYNLGSKLFASLSEGYHLKKPRFMYPEPSPSPFISDLSSFAKSRSLPQKSPFAAIKLLCSPSSLTANQFFLPQKIPGAQPVKPTQMGPLATAWYSAKWQWTNHASSLRCSSFFQRSFWPFVWQVSWGPKEWIYDTPGGPIRALGARGHHTR